MWLTIICGIISFALVSLFLFFVLLRDWTRATYVVWINTFLFLLSPRSPWKQTGILPNLIFVLLWSWCLFLFAKEKKRPALLVSLLTFFITIFLVFGPPFLMGSFFIHRF